MARLLDAGLVLYYREGLGGGEGGWGAEGGQSVDKA